MEQKQRFVSLAATGRFTLTELCVDFHVSRKTGYKWLRRYRELGTVGLRERSRRPHGCIHQTAEQIERLLLRERRRHRKRPGGDLLTDQSCECSDPIGA